MDKEWRFPWKEPFGIYDTDGPDGKAEFVLDGHKFLVSATGDDGVHTSRNRYRVECLTCGLMLHPNTTGPSSRVKSHLRDVAEKNSPTHKS